MTESVSTGFLLTDQYQLTMSQLYFKLGLQDKQAQFDHFFRDYPDYGGHKAGFCINAGLGWFYEWMVDARITETDLEFLRNHKGNSGKAVFHDDFLEYLQQQGHYESLRIDAIPEGRVIHPNVPITVVRGPLPIVQIIETALLNKVNYQILLATKAARIRLSGRGQLLLEFGARRGQDLGANAGVRAALITETYSARQGVEHDDMNLMCLGGRVIGPELARELVFAFANARYSGEARHNRRLDKLKQIENANNE